MTPEGGFDSGDGNGLGAVTWRHCHGTELSEEVVTEHCRLGLMADLRGTHHNRY